MIAGHISGLEKTRPPSDSESLFAPSNPPADDAKAVPVAATCASTSARAVIVAMIDISID